MVAGIGNTAGRPSASSRDLKMLQHYKKPLLERRSASRLAPVGALAGPLALAMVASTGNTAGSPSASSRDLKMLLQ
ncbi:hypothetical protein DU505_09955 [Billgrantia montanilacus]|uniref:Uncharacterized protein n=1 Tax=Billgrantia montanilacus TaxID=2282305 RepID=A0A368TZX1_9GAMM|nr:hypothetical protein DU505_09955 [Halomonas montanilacus]